MNAKEFLSKSKPIIIIILLFSLSFFLRAESANLNIIPDDMKAFYQDQDGLPYFSEMDSYYNYRLTQNYLNNGHLGDTIINGTQWDLHSYFPPGRTAEYPPLIVYLTAFIYKFVNIFSGVSLVTVAFWMAPFIASICVIPAYLFIRRITNDFGGITAGILVGVAPFYFSHTFAGFFDTDMFNMLFPILIVWFFIESIRANSIRNRSIFVILTVISLFLFTLAWEGWWYIFYIIVGSAVIYLLVSNYLLGMKTIKPVKEYSSKFEWFIDQKALFSVVVVVLASSILIIINSGLSGFINTLFRPLVVNQLLSSTTNAAYPNVLVSISELQIPTFSSVLNGVGGIGAFLLGILSVPLLIWKLQSKDGKKAVKQEAPKIKKKPRRKGRRKNIQKNVEEKTERKDTVKGNKETAEKRKLMETKKEYVLYAVLFSIWLLITAYAMTKGSRFIATFSLPIALGAGIFIGLIAPSVNKYIKNTKYCAVAILLLIALVSYPAVSGAYGISNSVVPGSDDSFYNSMSWIKNNTSNDTVITSWWDYGYLFEAVGDRPTTFDGGSQNNPRAYWVGKALLTNNENLSAGILRMLTSSGDLGYLTLENYTRDTAKSVEILDKILPVDKNAAQTIMVNEYKLTPDQAQNVLKYTHPDKPSPHVFITSSDMIGKAGWWSYFGSWNFKENTGQGYMYSVSGATTNVTGSTVTINAENGVGGQINGSSFSAWLQANNTRIEPHKLIFIQNGKLVYNQVVTNDSPVSILFIQENNSLIAVAMNKELEDSMFTRLMFMGGYGLTRFKLAHAQPGVIVWNVS